MTFILINTINLIFQVLIILIFVDVIASWVMFARVRLPDPILRLLSAIHDIVGVILNPIRRLIPSMGGLDLSPFIAILLLGFLQKVLVQALLRY